MKRILFAWEMGAGLGHLLPHRPVFAELVARGYEVHVAARELAQVRRAFGELPLVYWQSPLQPGNAEPKILPTASPVHILHNVGYGAADKVAASLAAWKNLLRSIEPDLVLVDYCPGVLLALRGTTIPVASISTGFDVPPNRSPWLPFALPGLTASLDELARGKQKVSGTDWVDGTSPERTGT